HPGGMQPACSFASTRAAHPARSPPARHRNYRLRHFVRFSASRRCAASRRHALSPCPLRRTGSFQVAPCWRQHSLARTRYLTATTSLLSLRLSHEQVKNHALHIRQRQTGVVADNCPVRQEDTATERDEPSHRVNRLAAHRITDDHVGAGAQPLAGRKRNLTAL